MKIKIQKANSGVNFIALRADGKPQARRTRAVASALSMAFEWYHQEVIKAFDLREIGNTGYAEQFKRSIPTYDDGGTRHREGKPSSFLPLEPWGFALACPPCSGTGKLRGEKCDLCTGFGVAMNDSGSTPTPGRARVLLCYQLPLIRVEREDKMFGYEIIKDF